MRSALLILASLLPPDAGRAEAAVKAYILENVDDPEVKFARFGPHALRGEAGITREFILGAEADAADYAHLNVDRDEVLRRVEKLPGGALPVARARYRCKNRAGALVLHDMLFIVRGNSVIPLTRCPPGDWIAELAGAVKAWKEYRKLNACR